MAKKKAKSKRPSRGADGLFHVQVYIGRHPNGKKFYKRFSGRDWDELQFEILTYKKEFEAGMHPDGCDEPVRPMTLGEAIDKYIDTCRNLCCEEGDYSPSTIPGYKSIRKNAFKPFIDKPITQITVDDVQTYIDTAVSERTGKKKTGKTLRNEFYLLKPVMDKYAPEVDLRKIKLAKRKRRKKMTMRMADAPAILKAAYDIKPDFFLYTMLTMVLGLRPSESYALFGRCMSAEPQVALIDGQKMVYGEIVVERAAVMNEDRVYQTKESTKTEAGTRVLRHDWSFFETFYAVKPHAADNERVLQMTPRQQQYYWDILRKRLGLPEKMRFYDLRHYHCSVMVASGAPEDYIAADMGHSTIDMAHNVYVELIEEKQQNIDLSVASYTSDLMHQFRQTTAETTKQTTKNALFLEIAR